MNFAERIVALRKKCGMSQEQLAERQITSHRKKAIFKYKQIKGRFSPNMVRICRFYLMCNVR